MQTTLEELDKHKVKLSVDVPADEAKPVLALAYRHLADQVKIPGFRKGKVPRKIIDAQVGRGEVLKEFLQHALSDFYMKAVREHRLAPIDDPEFDDVDVADVEGAGFRFTATVEVRPRLEFSEKDYRGLRIERPSQQVAEADVDEQLDRLRDRFAELEVVGHPARRGDYAIADVRATLNEEEIPEAGAQDILYEVGSGALVPELDQELEGKRKGDILKFNAKLPEGLGERGGQEVTFQVLVKEVKAKVLPALDDEFAKTSSEFDTLDDLRGDIREKLGTLKEAAVDGAVRERALQALIDLVTVEIPERLVDRETQSRVESATRRAARQGLTLERVLEASGMDELQFRSDARAHAVRAIKADLALEAVARAGDVQVTDEDMERAIQGLAQELEHDPKQLRKDLERTGQVTSLAGDIIRDRALDLVVEHAEIVGEPGSPNAGKG